jgi:hypothetical protein
VNVAVLVPVEEACFFDRSRQTFHVRELDVIDDRPERMDVGDPAPHDGAILVDLDAVLRAAAADLRACLAGQDHTFNRPSLHLRRRSRRRILWR